MTRHIGDVILQVDDLHTYCFTRWGVVKAVDGVSFALRQGETLGIVGESGCGKSMTALSLLRLVPRPVARIVQGRVLLQGENLLDKSEREMRHIRGRRLSMILQDPQTSLNPVFTIGNQLLEAIHIHHKGRARALLSRAISALSQVRVAAPERRVEDYPHQMSGGMKQRVVGAIALSCEPHVIIADEPTTSLDVTIQAQYLRLLREIQEETGLSIIFITHDFWHCGEDVRSGHGDVRRSGGGKWTRAGHFQSPGASIYAGPVAVRTHEGMNAPNACMPSKGKPHALWELPPGCRFAARCPYVEARCEQTYPSSFAVGVDHTADCWRLQEA